MSDPTHIGPHTMRIEEDLGVIRLEGMLNHAEAQAFLSLLADVLAKYGRLYLLFDNTNSPSIEPAARQLFVQWSRSHRITAVANFGGGVVQRTLAFLLVNAIRLVVKSAPVQMYAATEAEARMWIAAQRRLPR